MVLHTVWSPSISHPLKHYLFQSLSLEEKREHNTGVLEVQGLVWGGSMHEGTVRSGPCISGEAEEVGEQGKQERGTNQVHDSKNRRPENHTRVELF